MLYRLPDNDYYFPDPRSIPDEEREPNGFFAVGGDLSVPRLIEAYSMGVFPWTAFEDLDVPPGQEKTFWNLLRWYCPMERFVIFPDEIHVSHSMRALFNKGTYSVTFNEAFPQVIANCSQLRIDEEGAWLGPQMIRAYTKLHDMGYAASVEVWRDGRLAGGLYGVTLLRAFFGESMFSLEPSASKVALIALARRMRETGGKFIDCQMETPHLKSMGGRHISYDEYMERLYT